MNVRRRGAGPRTRELALSRHRSQPWTDRMTIMFRREPGRIGLLRKLRGTITRLEVTVAWVQEASSSGEQEFGQKSER